MASSRLSTLAARYVLASGALACLVAATAVDPGPEPVLRASAGREAPVDLERERVPRQTREARVRERRPIAPGRRGSLVVVPGSSPGSEPDSGADMLFVVEVEGGLRVDRVAVARAVTRILFDRRSWAGAGGFSLRRVDSGPADFRVALASPELTDLLCLPLLTNGLYSCASEDRAVVNALRWRRGAASYNGRLSAYRRYVVNHEVGHVLGLGHAGCPGAGEPAPVMLQQTKGVAPCRANPWPLPRELAGG